MLKKGLPALEDMIGGFAVVITQDDGVNPFINLNMLGRHSVGTGSAPQAVITSLVTDPLDRNGLKITDIDKYSPEMQNPDITKPAGAGDVPLANYKMIGALAVKRGELQRAELANFTVEHGLTGFAPTQGHIPSGVPYVALHGRHCWPAISSVSWSLVRVLCSWAASPTSLTAFPSSSRPTPARRKPLPPWTIPRSAT